MVSWKCKRCWLRAARALLLWEFPPAALQVLSVGCHFHCQQQDLVSVSQTPPEMGLQPKGAAWVCCLRCKTLLYCGVIPALHSHSSQGCGSPLIPVRGCWVQTAGTERENCSFGASINLLWHLTAPQGEAFGNLRAQCHLLLSLSVIPLCLQPSLVISFSLHSMSCRAEAAPPHGTVLSCLWFSELLN